MTGVGEVYGPFLGEDCEGSIHVPLLSVHWKVLFAKNIHRENVGEPYSLGSPVLK